MLNRSFQSFKGIFYFRFVEIVSMDEPLTIYFIQKPRLNRGTNQSFPNLLLYIGVTGVYLGTFLPKLLMYLFRATCLLK